MSLFPKRTLTLTILLAELLGVSIPLVPKAVLDYHNQNRAIQIEFESNLNRIRSNLELGLISPLWNFSPQDTQNVIQSALKFSFIQKIDVFDGQKQLIGTAANPEFSVQNGSALAKAEPQTLAFEIRAQDRIIGTCNIQYSLQEISTQKVATIRYLILSNGLVLFLILTLTYFLLRYTVVHKVLQLKKEFAFLKDKKLDHPFQWIPGDEINDLGIALEEARKELYRANQELINANETLEARVQERGTQLAESARLASLGEMAAGIAHEINNPLAIISGKANKLRRLVLTRDTDQAPEIKELDSIQTTVERISKIIRGLRSFSRDGSQDSLESTFLKTILEETLDICRTRFKNNSVELRVRPFNESLAVKCRPVQLGQVLLNLLGNAFDAVAELDEKWVEIKIEEEGNRVKISVVDSGKGIPPEVRSKIMDPFFTTKPVGKGTGLGLSISKGIIESHGGTFQLDSNSPHTCFVIVLPLSEKASLKAS